MDKPNLTYKELLRIFDALIVCSIINTKESERISKDTEMGIYSNIYYTNIIRGIDDIKLKSAAKMLEIEIFHNVFMWLIRDGCQVMFRDNSPYYGEIEEPKQCKIGFYTTDLCNVKNVEDTREYKYRTRNSFHILMSLIFLVIEKKKYNRSMSNLKSSNYYDMIKKALNDIALDRGICDTSCPFFDRY